MRVIFQWSLLSAIYSRKYGNLSKQMVIDMSATPNENEQKNKQWVWLAIDQGTGEVIGVFVGDRSQNGAQGLWDSLPVVYRQHAVCYTDFWEAYRVIFPAKQHQAVGKETGLTNKIERLNCTFRQRISRLVRKTLSFSKKIENHIGAIWYFVHHYNKSLSVATA